MRDSSIRQSSDSTIYSPEREILRERANNEPILRSDEAGIRDAINHLAEVNIRNAEKVEMNESPAEYADNIEVLYSGIQDQLNEAIGTRFCQENTGLMLAIIELKASIETLVSMTLKEIRSSRDKFNIKAVIGFSLLKELPASINSIAWNASHLPDRISDGGIELDVQPSVLEGISAKVDNNWRMVQGSIEAMNRVTGIE